MVPERVRYLIKSFLIRKREGEREREREKKIKIKSTKWETRLVKTHTSFRYSNRNIKEHFFAKTQYNTMNHYIFDYFYMTLSGLITYVVMKLVNYSYSSEEWNNCD